MKTKLPDSLPREKLIQDGPDTLTNSELLSIIWGHGDRRENVFSMADRVLSSYDKNGISKYRSAGVLASSFNIGKHKAAQLLAGLELGYRLCSNEHVRRPRISEPATVFRLHSDMSYLNREEVRGIYLDARLRLISSEIIAIGSLNSCNISPREIFRPAIELSAYATILIHNHPSGDESPSQEDISFTRRLDEAGELIGIRFLDHVIIANSGYTSIKWK